MRAVKSQNTSPELLVRRLLRSMGETGYRLHRNDLPGKPDLAFIARKAAIFVHGCFWHGHDCPRGARTPKTNQDYWLPKIERTRQRDIQHKVALQSRAWRVLVVWECETADLTHLRDRLTRFLVLG